ncbi:hypothetical protein [Oricola sp.]|uniref:hypothetical protein n=1 Tax=Oricola sp. TaxID=1979950 RepID=UPI0025D826AD|nr:hypothetical protein [Oricola sp.]MCI5078378.1 hypothetical protein [Oricola sp.]
MRQERSGSILSTVRLSDFGLRREPPRPLNDRQPGYEALFDYDTLFYDVFRSCDGRKILCPGPPQLNCEPFLADMRFRLNEDFHPLEAVYRPSQMHLQPNGRYELSVPIGIDPRSLTIEACGRSVTVPVRGSGCGIFRDRRVVLTMVKNTPMQWIRDWAQFNIRIHGAESVILYDNGSSTYAPGALQRMLDDLDARGPHLVIDWDFPYGPGVGPRNVQDSFYCQPGGLDHARRRFCAQSRSVLNCDIDELVVGPKGVSVFDEAEAQQGPGLHIHGQWAELVGEPRETSDAPGATRHLDFRFSPRKQSLWRWLGRYDRLLRTKWVAVPAQCDDRIDWTVHALAPPDQATGTVSKPTLSKRFLYRHFRQLTTKDAAKRRRIKRHDPVRYRVDRALVLAMREALQIDPS